MQFNLRHNIDKQDSLSGSDPIDIVLPYNAGRRIGIDFIHSSSLNRSPTSVGVPDSGVSLVSFINARIEDEDIIIPVPDITASDVSYIPINPLISTEVQGALDELTDLYNELPDYTFTNGLLLSGEVVGLGGDLVENTVIGGSFNMEFFNNRFIIKGLDDIRIQTPQVLSGGIVATDRLLQAQSLTAGVEYTSFKVPTTNGTIGQILALDADNETLI